jgi:hypothetical protein
METIGIIIGVLVIAILLAVLVTYLIVVHTANKIKKRAGKFLATKGVDIAVKVGEKYLDKK